MNNVSLFFKLGYKFLARYLKEYFIVLIKPLLAFFLSLIFLPLCNVSPVFVVPAILAIPVTCWALWRMYVIFYAIIPACYDFLKNGAKADFKNIVQNVNQKKLVSFALFSSIIYAFPFIVLLIHYISTNKSYSVEASFEYLFSVLIFGAIALLLIVPFMSFSLQAFFFKKSNENYLSVLKNCYKYLDLEGIITLILLGLINFIAGSIPVVCLFSWLIITPYFYAVCAFWYYSRIQKGN